MLQMGQSFKFQERSIYITTFYEMSKVLNKRQPSAVTECALCTTSLLQKLKIKILTVKICPKCFYDTSIKVVL